MTDFSVLDDPAWHALTTDHAALGQRNGAAARYRADLSPLGGLARYDAAAFAQLRPLVAPDELHPLVRSALFPAYPAPDRPAGPPLPEPPPPVRVRCRGEWHMVRSRGGRLEIPHGDEERRRELALGAFGGTVNGCFGAQRTWTAGTGWLPRVLRDHPELGHIGRLTLLESLWCVRLVLWDEKRRLLVSFRDVARAA